MAVTLDTTGSAVGISGTGVTTYAYTNMTVGAALSNGALVAMALFPGNGATALTMTWDAVGANQALTSILKVTPSSGDTIALFGLVNPVSGNKTLTLSWSGAAANGVLVDAISFKGVNQTGGTSSFANANSASALSNAGPAAVTITSNSNDAVVAAFLVGLDLLTINNTTIFLNNTVTGCGANYVLPASSSNVMQATFSGTPNWLAIGVDVVAAATVTPIVGARLVMM